MDPAILKRHSFAPLADEIKPHQNREKLCGVNGLMKPVRQYVKNMQVGEKILVNF